MTVSVVSCVYGDHYRRFIPRWQEAIAALDPAPDAVIVGSDSEASIKGAKIVASFCHWQHPQAWHLQRAIMAATTEWVWIVDIDDIPFPDGLQGLDEVAADVWQIGFERSDGELHYPPTLTPEEYLGADKNMYVGASMIRTDIFREVGGFSDVALQDWSLWRKLARHGATVQASDRLHFQFMRHPRSRGAIECTADARPEHMEEMLRSEHAYA